jgi:excisionase family DNA binding protein
MSAGGDPMTDEGLWDSRQVQAVLGCSLRMVQKLVQTRQLPARRLGVLYRFEPADVRAFRKNLPVAGVPTDRRKKLQVLA